MAGLRTTAIHWGSSAVDLTGKDLPSLKARFLVDRVPPAGTVLEVGSGEGKLLRTLGNTRPGLNMHGCDIRMPQVPPDCYTFHLISDGIPLADDSVDVALIFDVLEHVPDPGGLLAEVARTLRPRGRLIAFVPVEGEPISFYSLFRKILGQDTYVLTKEHIQAFRHRELRDLLGQSFKVLEWRYAYHFLGQLMDASFFAAARHPRLRRFWWQENTYYNNATTGKPIARVLNRALKFGNGVAYFESQVLRRVRYGSAGVLLLAEVL